VGPFVPLLGGDTGVGTIPFRRHRRAEPVVTRVETEALYLLDMQPWLWDTASGEALGLTSRFLLLGGNLRTKREIPMSENGNQSSHTPRSFKKIGGAHPSKVWDKAMPPRNLIVVGVVAVLLCAVFNNNALPGSFTNGDVITHVEADWGDTPTSNNAAGLLQANYDSVYASTFGSLEVGISGSAGFSMVFTGASHLLAYLPNVGAIGPLDDDLVNPDTTSSGAFGGEVATLKLNIDFSDAGFLPGNLGVHLGDLVLQGFSTKSNLRGLNGLPVRQFSAIVNTLLGGGSFGSFTIAELDPIVANLNACFGGGMVDSFATDHLAVPQVPLVMQAASHSGNSITLTWSTTPASMYQVQFITDLTQTNWTNLGSPIRATNFTWTASDTTTNSHGFYRIDQLP
jgi:hypothetical protein